MGLWKIFFNPPNLIAKVLFNLDSFSAASHDIGLHPHLLRAYSGSLSLTLFLFFFKRFMSVCASNAANDYYCSSFV